MFWDTGSIGTPSIFAKIIIFKALCIGTYQKFQEKSAIFEILSNGTHQNSAFPSEIFILKCIQISAILCGLSAGLVD